MILEQIKNDTDKCICLFVLTLNSEFFFVFSPPVFPRRRKKHIHTHKFFIGTFLSQHFDALSEGYKNTDSCAIYWHHIHIRTERKRKVHIQPEYVDYWYGKLWKSLSIKFRGCRYPSMSLNVLTYVISLNRTIDLID